MVTIKEYPAANKKRLTYQYMQPLQVEKKYRKKNSTNEEKLENNIARAKSTIYEIALCNHWEWWFTATLDPKKYDRSNLLRFRTHFTRFIQAFGRAHDLNIKYLLIPELHADKTNWHMHGFIMGLPQEYLTPFSKQEHLPTYILNKLESGSPIYNWLDYSERFGFCDFEPISTKDLPKLGRYVTKYITKDLGRAVSQLGAHTYFASHGLQRANVIAKGILREDANINYDYKNDYIKIKWYDSTDTPEELIYFSKMY